MSYRRGQNKVTQDKLDLAYCQLVWDKIPYKNKSQTFSRIVGMKGIDGRVISKFLKPKKMGGSSSYKMPEDYKKIANIDCKRPQDVVRPTLDLPGKYESRTLDTLIKPKPKPRPVVKRVDLKKELQALCHKFYDNEKLSRLQKKLGVINEVIGNYDNLVEVEYMLYNSSPLGAALIKVYSSNIDWSDSTNVCLKFNAKKDGDKLQRLKEIPDLRVVRIWAKFNYTSDKCLKLQLYSKYSLDEEMIIKG